MPQRTPAREDEQALIKAAGAEPIPGYRLIAPLGKGGFGEVWKCEAPGGLFKAIKFVRNQELFGNNNSEAEQELRALQHIKSIRHPFLLSMDRVESIHDELVIVMELADRCLHDLLVEYQDKGKAGIPREELLCYLLEAAEVLDLMNLEYGLAHLDIKPRNLFLVRNHVKVADFGLVSSLADLNGPHGGKAQIAAITPTYASPESFLGKITLFSDQYSLAIVYHELLTGRLPFTGKNFRQLALQHTQLQPDLSALPAGDRPAVTRALCKEPRKRYPSCTDFIQALISQQVPEGWSNGDTARVASCPKNPTLIEVKLGDDEAPPVQRPSRSMPRLAPADTGLLNLDQYRFLDCLGRTALGEMWQAEAPDGRPRLIKLVNTFAQSGLLGEDDPVVRLGQLRHQGLVQTLYLPRDDNRLAMISPILTDSLGSRLQEYQEKRIPGIPRDELLEYLAEAAQILDDLHEHFRLQHLGLNPRNLHLDEGQVRIADYGLVPLIWLPAGQPVAQMNARYSAPELFDGKVSRHCDQYSLALIFHEMLTGEPLFGTLGLRQLVQARSCGKFDMDLIVGPDRPILQRALNPDPERRFKSCHDFVAALMGESRRVSRPARSAVLPAVNLSGSVPRIPSPSGQHSVVDLSLGLSPVAQQAIEELVAASVSPFQLRKHGNFQYLLQPGLTLEHRCHGRMLPNTSRLRLRGFVDETRAQLVENTDESYLYWLPLKPTFWQRCLGRQPRLNVLVALNRPETSKGSQTEVFIRLTPAECTPEQAEEALEKLGPLLVASLRTHLTTDPERREQPRFPLHGTLTVCPVNEAGQLLEPVTCEARNISLDGLGLLLPFEPPPYLLVRLPRPARNTVVSALARVVSAIPSPDGRYEVGLCFVQK